MNSKQLLLFVLMTIAQAIPPQPIDSEPDTERGRRSCASCIYPRCNGFCPNRRVCRPKIKVVRKCRCVKILPLPLLGTNNFSAAPAADDSDLELSAQEDEELGKLGESAEQPAPQGRRLLASTEDAEGTEDPKADASAAAHSLIPRIQIPIPIPIPPIRIPIRCNSCVYPLCVGWCPYGYRCRRTFVVQRSCGC